MQETWKFYKKTYGPKWGIREYYVSDLGNVKINGALKVFDNNIKGYYTIARQHVHRIVAELFIPNPENKPCIDHINGNRHDNRVINLRWCTYKENNNNPITNTRQSEAAINRFKNNTQRDIISDKLKTLWQTSPELWAARRK